MQSQDICHPLGQIPFSSDSPRGSVPCRPLFASPGSRQLSEADDNGRLRSAPEAGVGHSEFEPRVEWRTTWAIIKYAYILRPRGGERDQCQRDT